MSPGHDDLGGEYDKIVSAVEDAHRTIAAISRDSLRRAAPEIAVGEFAVLRSLGGQSSKRTSDLSHGLSMAPSTLTRYCDHLFRLKNITRERDPRDRREIRVDLTAKGRATVDRVLRQQRDDLGQYLALLTATDRRHLLRILGNLGQDLSWQQANETRPSA
jgi:DNA-binding MarR family transcriptional regulator